MGTPHRHLKAYLETRNPDRLALLRFPRGVTLEDAGYDWTSLFEDITEPIIPGDALDHLTGLGVDVVATGEEAASEALRRSRIENLEADPGAFAEDYLDANARLGGERCVTIREYAMHTYAGGAPLHAALRDCLPSMDDVYEYGDAAFRTRSLPDLLRLRIWGLVFHGLPYYTVVFVPCLLHGVGCRHYNDESYRPCHALSFNVLRQRLGARVAVSRRLLDDMKGDRDTRASRATRAVARIILDTLPEDSWVGTPRDANWSTDFLPMVAAAAAETCEEYKMLVLALRECKSPREMVRRSREPSWVVSRALENLRDGW